MKKMVMVLMMVFGLSAVFADSYVAFTSNKGVETYYASDHANVFDVFVKAMFAIGTTNFTSYQKKNTQLIVVADDEKATHLVMICKDETMKNVYDVVVFDFYKDCNVNVDSAKGFRFEVDLKTDPVIVGLGFIKEKVIQLRNVDKDKVVYNTYEVKQTETGNK